jgi:hypothetical protein
VACGFLHHCVPYNRGRDIILQEMKQKWGCLTAGDAQQIPQAELMACFGERLGTYAWKAVRGFQADKGDQTGH